jgi:thiol:disulfide interchange protein DsbC
VGHKLEYSVITIFTDVDCPFCRRIHEELDTYIKAGITVKYLFYPRAGRESSAYSSLVSVWCSDDRYTALEKVEAGQHIATKRCKHPVDKHLGLAKRFNLLGTPAIFLQDGTLIVGYKRPDDLIKLAFLHSN